MTSAAAGSGDCAPSRVVTGSSYKNNMTFSNRMFEQVLSTISKSPAERSNNDISITAVWLSRKFDVFKQLNQGA
jgi:hypothetical protein